MSKGPKSGHGFPSDFGFTGSSGRVSVRPHSRAPRKAYAMGGPVKARKGGVARKLKD